MPTKWGAVAQRGHLLQGSRCCVAKRKHDGQQPGSPVGCRSSSLIIKVRVSVVHRVGSLSTCRGRLGGAGPCSRVGHTKGRELFVSRGGVTGFCAIGTGSAPPWGCSWVVFGDTDRSPIPPGGLGRDSCPSPCSSQAAWETCTRFHWSSLTAHPLASTCGVSAWPL